MSDLGSLSAASSALGPSAGGGTPSRESVARSSREPTATPAGSSAAEPSDYGAGLPPGSPRAPLAAAAASGAVGALRAKAREIAERLLRCAPSRSVAVDLPPTVDRPELLRQGVSEELRKAGFAEGAAGAAAPWRGSFSLTLGDSASVASALADYAPPDLWVSVPGRPALSGWYSQRIGEERCGLPVWAREGAGAAPAAGGELPDGGSAEGSGGGSGAEGAARGAADTAVLLYSRGAGYWMVGDGAGKGWLDSNHPLPTLGGNSTSSVAGALTDRELLADGGGDETRLRRRVMPHCIYCWRLWDGAKGWRPAPGTTRIFPVPRRLHVVAQHPQLSGAYQLSPVPARDMPVWQREDADGAALSRTVTARTPAPAPAASSAGASTAGEGAGPEAAAGGGAAVESGPMSIFSHEAGRWVLGRDTVTAGGQGWIASAEPHNFRSPDKLRRWRRWNSAGRNWVEDPAVRVARRARGGPDVLIYRLTQSPEQLRMRAHEDGGAEESEAALALVQDVRDCLAAGAAEGRSDFDEIIALPAASGEQLYTILALARQHLVDDGLDDFDLSTVGDCVDGMPRPTHLRFAHTASMMQAGDLAAAIGRAADEVEAEVRRAREGSWVDVNCPSLPCHLVAEELERRGLGGFVVRPQPRGGAQVIARVPWKRSQLWRPTTDSRGRTVSDRVPHSAPAPRASVSPPGRPPPPARAPWQTHAGAGLPARLSSPSPLLPAPASQSRSAGGAGALASAGRCASASIGSMPYGSTEGPALRLQPRPVSRSAIAVR